MRKNLTEKGFTLVELAIVMVIIGLMIGAVLKGQAMIDDAKQKRMLTDLQGISAAYFMYYDRYSAIPGDDITSHGWSGVSVGGGNGYIGGNNNTDGQEGHEAWQSLRYVGLLSGDPAATGAAHVPNHPYGGKFYLGNMNFGNDIGTKNRIQITGIPGSVAETIDIKLDDGIYSTGTVQASDSYISTDNEIVNVYYAL